jgi:hypothetical protein
LSAILAPMKSLPNILTGARLVMALFVFVAISVAVGGFPPVSDNLTPEAQFSLQRWAVIRLLRRRHHRFL